MLIIAIGEEGRDDVSDLNLVVRQMISQNPLPIRSGAVTAKLLEDDSPLDLARTTINCGGAPEQVTDHDLRSSGGPQPLERRIFEGRRLVEACDASQREAPEFRDCLFDLAAAKLDDRGHARASCGVACAVHAIDQAFESEKVDLDMRQTPGKGPIEDHTAVAEIVGRNPRDLLDLRQAHPEIRGAGDAVTLMLEQIFGDGPSVVFRADAVRYRARARR